MSGALKWSPFESAGWTSAQEVRVGEFVDAEAPAVRAALPGADEDPDRGVSVAADGRTLPAGHGLPAVDSAPNGLHSTLLYRPYRRE